MGLINRDRTNWNDKKQVLRRVRLDGRELACSAAFLQDDPEVVLAALQQNANAIISASDRFQASPAWVLLAAELVVNQPHAEYGPAAIIQTSKLSSEQKSALTAVLEAKKQDAGVTIDMSPEPGSPLWTASLGPRTGAVRSLTDKTGQ